MTKLNVRNRTLAVMDNLPFLRSINNETMRNYKPLTEMVHLGQATQFAFEHITQQK